MNIGIAAIFRDERDYILEWLAWHLIAGFENFYIADNGSSDGTLALLEALELAGYIKLLYQPVQPHSSQLKAYERILQNAAGECHALLFIDADEFLCHDSFIDGEEYRSVHSLLEDPTVGAVALSWRLFGSSGREHFDSLPVIERFDRHAEYPQSRLIKSVVKIPYVTHMSVHYGKLQDGYTYVDAQGQVIGDFITFKNGQPARDSVSGMREAACSTPLMINHYVVKSKQEFVEKKIRRGDAMLGINYERSMDFFKEHDRNELRFNFPSDKISRLKEKIDELTDELNRLTPLKLKLRGHVDFSSPQKLHGWIVSSMGTSEDLEVNIFVNGIYQGSTRPALYRPDLALSGISISGLSGFTWVHLNPLRAGDTVEIKINANPFSITNGLAVIG